MKSLNKLIYLLVLLSIAFISCQKEFTPGDDDLEPPVVTTDSIYIDKLYDLYDEGSGLDTQAISRFIYDSRKRLIAIVDSSMDGTQNHDSLLYFYNGIDTLPYRLSDRSVIDPGTEYDQTDTYFFYDAQKRKIQDSVINSYISPGNVSTSTRVFKYSYGSNLIYGQVWETDGINPGIELMYKDTATVNAYGDVLSSKRYKLIAGNYVLNTTSTFTYDTRQSPFSRISMFAAHRMLPNGETILGEYMGFYNVATQNEETIDPAYTFSQNFIYEYNSRGLTTKAKSDVGTPEEGALIFTYKNL